MDLIFGPVLSCFDFGIFRVYGAIFRFVIEHRLVIAIILIILSFKYGFFEVFGMAFCLAGAYLSVVFLSAIIYTAYDTICWISEDFGKAAAVIIGLLGLYALLESTSLREVIFAYIFSKWFFK